MGWEVAWCAGRGADWNEDGAPIGQHRAQAAGLGGVPTGWAIRARVSLVSQVREGFLRGRWSCSVEVNEPVETMYGGMDQKEDLHVSVNTITLFYLQ